MTTIENSHGGALLSIDAKGALVEIWARGCMCTCSRAKFLAAVATELNVLIIPRTDLPEVDEGDAYYAVSDRGDDIAKPFNKVLTGAQHRRLALEHLALAEYLDAHPPIDQAQVNTLATLLRDTGARPSGADAIPIARRLIATGRVTVTDPA